jgi:hypothetical protein
VANQGNVASFSGINASSPQTLATANDLSGYADSFSFTREFWPKLRQAYNDKGLIDNGLMAYLVDNKAFIGTPVRTIEIYHAEEDSVLQSVSVISFTGGASAGASAVITITAQTFGSTPLYINYATVGQLFQIASNPLVQLRVTSVTLPAATGGTTHTITVEPASDVQIDTVLAANDILLPQDAVYASGDAFPNGSTRAWNRYGVNWQYQMTATPEYGKEMYNQTFAFQVASTGQTFLAPKLFNDCMIIDMIRTSAALLKGSGETIGGDQQTTGVITAAQVFGMTDDYAIGGFQLADWLSVGDQQEAAQVGTTSEVFAGANWIASSTQNNLALYTAGALQYLSASEYNRTANAEIKRSLGVLTFNNFTYKINKATELSHKYAYSPIDSTTGVQSQGYWPNVALFIPDEKIAVQKGLTNTSYEMEAPLFRVLQLMNPIDFGGPNVMNRVIPQGSAILGAEKFKVTLAKDFAAQSMLASKYYFAGAVI